MPTLRAKVQVVLDGRPCFQAESSQEGDLSQSFIAKKAASALDKSLPIEGLQYVKGILFRNGDQPVTIRFNGIASGGIDVNPRGGIILSKCSIGPGPSANARILNTGTETAGFSGIAVGDT